MAWSLIVEQIPTLLIAFSDAEAILWPAMRDTLFRFGLRPPTAEIEQFRPDQRVRGGSPCRCGPTLAGKPTRRVFSRAIGTLEQWKSEEDIPEEEIERLHREFLDEVEAVQKQQLPVLEWLAKQGHTDIWVEGLTDDSIRLEVRRRLQAVGEVPHVAFGTRSPGPDAGRGEDEGAAA